MAADTVRPLIEVKELPEFSSTQEAVEKALGFARPLASEAPCESMEEAGRIADEVRNLAMVRANADRTRLSVTAAYRATTEAVNAEFNELLAPVKAAEAALKQKGLAWQRAEEARAREEARRRQEELNREAEAKLKEAQEAAELAAEDSEDEELRKLAEETREEAAAAAVRPSAPLVRPPTAARGSTGRLSSRTVYRFDVTDEASVPDQFKVVDRGLIKARIKAEADSVKASPGSTFSLEIPGVRIYTEDVPVSGGVGRL